MAPLPGGPELLLSALRIMFTIYIHHIPFVCCLAAATAYQLVLELEAVHGPAAVQLLR
jgi:hypothetical protein